MVDVRSGIPEVWILLLDDFSSFINVGDPLNRFFNCWQVSLNLTKDRAVEWGRILVYAILILWLLLID